MKKNNNEVNNKSLRQKFLENDEENPKVSGIVNVAETGDQGPKTDSSFSYIFYPFSYIYSYISYIYSYISSYFSSAEPEKQNDRGEVRKVWGNNQENNITNSVNNPIITATDLTQSKKTTSSIMEGSNNNPKIETDSNQNNLQNFNQKAEGKAEYRVTDNDLTQSEETTNPIIKTDSNRNNLQNLDQNAEVKGRVMVMYNHDWNRRLNKISTRSYDLSTKILSIDLSQMPTVNEGKILLDAYKAAKNSGFKPEDHKALENEVEKSRLKPIIELEALKEFCLSLVDKVEKSAEKDKGRGVVYEGIKIPDNLKEKEYNLSESDDHNSESIYKELLPLAKKIFVRDQRAKGYSRIAAQILGNRYDEEFINKLEEECFIERDKAKEINSLTEKVIQDKKADKKSGGKAR